MLIFLTGFMGSGKTKLGKQLAKQLNFSFTDTDSAIELLTGKSIQQIFDEHNENFFRQKEKDILHSFKDKSNLVIATGGGLPCFNDNMSWMNKNGLTVYLKLHHGVLFHRLLHDRSKRPLLANLDDIGLMEFIVEKLPEREFYYNQSKVTVNAFSLSEKDLYQTVSSIIN